MLKGIIFFEQGGAQLVGDVSSFAGILATIESVVPQLRAEEKSRVMGQLSDEELKALIEERAKTKRGK